MKENKVFLKGILGGLQVYIDPDTGLESIKKELGQKLDSSEFSKIPKLTLYSLAKNLVKARDTN